MKRKVSEGRVEQSGTDNSGQGMEPGSKRTLEDGPLAPPPPPTPPPAPHLQPYHVPDQRPVEAPPPVPTQKVLKTKMPAYRYTEARSPITQSALEETRDDKEERTYPPGYYPPRKRP